MTARIAQRILPPGVGRDRATLLSPVLSYFRRVGDAVADFVGRCSIPIQNQPLLGADAGHRDPAYRGKMLREWG